jgi:ATP-dependent DNA ligase
MAARIDNGHAQLLTRTGLDWSDKYPSVVEALAKVGRKPRISTANCAG